MYINQRYATTNLVVEQLQQLLETAGLHELSTRLRGLEVTDPASARVVRDILQRAAVPTEPALKEWFNIARLNIEWALKPCEQLPAAA